MRTPHSLIDRVVVSVRWLARLTSAVLAVGCLALLLYGLSEAFTGAPSTADSWTLVFLALVVIGAILAWSWEGLAGVILIVGGLYAALVETTQGVMDAGIWLTLALGVTFLACWGYSLLPLKRTAPLTPPAALPTSAQQERDLVGADRSTR
jgi:cbb3-type cytochrome oxidase subunit 3